MVNVYLDGTILIHTGGVEMGQGVQTKIIQVASRALNVPTSLIHIRETATSYVPNPTGTAGSHGADMFGGAVQVGDW